MKSALYDITNNDIIGFGNPIRIERNFRSLYASAYCIARKAYNRGRVVDLAINGAASVVISVTPDIGVVVWAHGKAVWVKEN